MLEFNQSTPITIFTTNTVDRCRITNMYPVGRSHYEVYNIDQKTYHFLPDADTAEEFVINSVGLKNNC